MIIESRRLIGGISTCIVVLLEADGEFADNSSSSVFFFRNGYTGPGKDDRVIFQNLLPQILDLMFNGFAFLSAITNSVAGLVA
jgi:hypothetical protein